MNLTPKEAQGFLRDYSEYVTTILKPTQDELRKILDRWRDPLSWARHQRRSRLPAPSPIQRTLTRIKRTESVIDKILRKPNSYPDGLSPNSFRRMDDALGTRIVTYFLTNLPLVDREIRTSEIFEVSDRSPPVVYATEGVPHPLDASKALKTAKPSGYLSAHYILRFRRSSIPASNRPWFELQVRTLLQDVWAEIEHVLAYKPDKRTSFAVRRQFQILSHQLQATDEHFNFLFEEQARFQQEINYKDDDPLNAENLPGVLAELGIGCSQSEMDGVLKLFASHNILIIGDIRRICTVSTLDEIRNIYRLKEGREPKNFEIVATLAALRDVTRKKDRETRIKGQIEFLKAWDSLRRRLR